MNEAMTQLGLNQHISAFRAAQNQMQKSQLVFAKKKQQQISEEENRIVPKSKSFTHFLIIEP